ncbi:pyruvate dehydrogenase complex dihydrolipoamide acetyltransferase [Alcaligenaceae bacterium]|nr:pyruvate dehydrogenase complex dihydrolipoamide acetyltransferase [Alcaligenaceae bacterium]
MAILIRMPEVAANTDSAVIVSWAKQEGDTVAQGDCLAEIETEKAVIEFNAEQSGVLGRILVQAGKDTEVGTPIAVLLEAGEKDADLSALLSADEGGQQAAGAAVGGAAADAPAAASPGPAAVEAVESGERIFASPLARRLARDAGVDLAGLKGSGPQGRIIKRDVRAARSAGPAVAPALAPAQAAAAAAAPGAGQAYTDVPHTSMRRTIARRLSESKQTVPHFYLRADCRVDALLALRGQINQAASRKISVNDFIVKAVAVALRELPDMNVSWTETALRRYDAIDVSVAVSTPTGLITPVVKAADARPLSLISGEIADLAQRAREGRLQPHEYQGGSFTVSNLGMYGVQEFAAIINPPQAAILAVGGFERRPVANDDGELGVASVMTVTLSVDHRAIDGALAAQWLGIFKTIVENPLSALI